LKDILLKKNAIVERVSDKDYMGCVLMKRRGIEHIYTFDKHFQNLDVRVVN